MTSTLGSIRCFAGLVVVALLVTIGVMVPPDADAQALNATKRTVSVPAEDGAIALYSNGFGFIGSTTLNKNTGAATGVKAAQCLDAVCGSRQTVFRDRNAVGSIEVAIDSGDLPVMAYIGRGNEVLLVQCTTSSCTNAVLTKVADGEGPIDLVLDANGQPVIAYGFGDELRVAHCSGTNCSNPSVEVVSTNGRAPSMELGSTGNPVIAFKTSVSPRGTFVATCADTTCASVANTFEIVRTASGGDASVAIDSNGFPVIATDDADGGMKLTYCDDALCDSFGTGGLGYVGAENVSMVLDAADRPILTFASYVADVLFCDDPACSSFHTVQLGPDAQVQSFKDNESPEIVLNSDGHPVIAYDGMNNNVRLVTCGDSRCGLAELPPRPSFFDGQTVTLQNVATGRYLDGNQGRVVDQSVNARADDQWVLGEVGDGFYLTNAVHGRFLDADANNNNVESSVNLGTDDEWVIDEVAPGTFTVSNVRFGGYLTADQSAPFNVVKSDTLTTAGQWQIVVVP